MEKRFEISTIDGGEINFNGRVPSKAWVTPLFRILTLKIFAILQGFRLPPWWWVNLLD